MKRVILSVMLIAALLLFRAGLASVPASAPALSPTDLGSKDCEERPTFAPDNRTVVYDGFVDGGRGLFKVDVETKQRTRLSQQKAEVWDYWEEWDHLPQLSPDGRSIVYLHDIRDGSEVRVMPSDGDGASEPITLGRTLGSVSWRDANTVLFIDETNHVMSVDTRTRKTEVLFTATPALIPISADNAGPNQLLMAAPGSTTQFFTTSYWIYDVVTHGLRAVSTDTGNSRFVGVAMSADKRWLYRITGMDGPSTRLVVSPLEPGAEETLAGIEHVTAGFSISPNRRRLVYSACQTYYSLGRLEANGAITELLPRTADAAFVVTTPIARNVLVYSELRTTSAKILSLDLTTKKSTVLVEDGYLTAITADHKILFMRAGKENSGIFVQSMGKQDERRLTNGPFDASDAQSFDHKWVYYVAALRPGDGGPIRRVPIKGGASELVISGQFDYVRSSPTEDLLVYQTTVDSQAFLKRGAAAPTPLFPNMPNISYENMSFSHDGKKLLLLRRAREIQEITLAGDHHPRVLKKLGNAMTMNAAYDLDGAPIFNMLMMAGGLMMAEGQFR